MQNSPENLSGGNLGNYYRNTSLIVSGQIIITLLLIGIAFVIAPKVDLDITPQTTNTLWILIICAAAGVFLLRRMLFNWQKLGNINLQKGVKGLLETMQMQTILLGSLTEIISITGFLISVMTGNKFEMFRAGAVALVVFLMIFPRKKTWEVIVSGLNKEVK